MAKKKTINGLPVFEARMTSENCGVLRVSLVDAPAVEADFVAYGEQKPLQLYKVTDEDKQRVFGCVLRADYPIYRRDDGNGEYYIVFKADEIRAFAQKYLAEGKQNAVDLDHDGTEIEGAEMVQYFIKDTAGGIAPEGFDEVADGSLFAEYQITDDDLWQRIKDGEFHGFSVEIIHACLPAEYTQIKTHMAKNTLLSRMKEALTSMVAEVEAEMNEQEQNNTEPAKTYKAVSTDKGSIHWDGDDELAEGVAVHGEDEEGNTVQLEDGDYTTDDKVIVVKDGKVAEIKEKAAEDEPKKEDEPKQDEESKQEPEQKDEKLAAVEAKCQEYSASYSDKYKKISEAIRTKLGAAAYFWLYDAGDDFAVICTYDADYNEHYYRYAIAWDGEDAKVEGEAAEGHIGFIANEAPAEDDFAAQKADYEAQIAAKDAELADLKAKLEAPAGQSAHEAYKRAQKVEYSANNPIEMAKAYLK